MEIIKVNELGEGKRIDAYLAEVTELSRTNIQRLIDEEKILNDLIEPIKKADLSPLEKFIAVYNIVKNFKPYKENKDDLMQSRYLRYILHNDYMVCVGYATLLECLLDKVEVPADYISVIADTSYDGGFDQNNPTEKVVEQSGHARVIDNMDDDKYNIHGLYMSDPTWDNGLKKDYLNHALMTFDNMTIDKRMFFFTFYHPILSFHSFNEFSRQVNYLLKHKINEAVNSKYKIYDNMNEIVLAAYKWVAKEILKTIECDDKIRYFKSLLNECECEKDYENLFTELGHYLLIRINKPIDKEIIMQANDEVRRKIDGINENTARMDFSEIDLKVFPYQIPDDESHDITARNSSK